jgi:hypothetical protein
LDVPTDAAPETCSQVIPLLEQGFLRQLRLHHKLGGYLCLLAVWHGKNRSPLA